MARRPRIVIPGCPHHLTHRSNRGETIFVSPMHHRLYLEWLHHYAAEHGMRVWAYCLMSNHVHLIAVPERPESLALAVGQAHARYSHWLSDRHDQSGHTWADRFFSIPMDAPHLWAALKYVELNPARAGLVSRPEDYPWSSAQAHVGEGVDGVLSLDLPLGGSKWGEGWRGWLHEGLEEAVLGKIRRCTRAGHPLGSREFVAQALKGRE